MLIRRICACIFLYAACTLLLVKDAAAARVDPWKSHMGAMVGLTSSQLMISGPEEATIRSGTLWSAGFGMFLKTADHNQFRGELQIGYSVIGASREILFTTADQKNIRIYDRYKTMPVTVYIIRNLGWKERFSAGLGVRSRAVLGHETRFPDPDPHTGVIISPPVQRWLGDVTAQFSLNTTFAEIAVSGWYDVNSVVRSSDAHANSAGVELMVKLRLLNLK